MHAVRQHPPGDGSPHQQSETPQPGPMGGLPGAKDEGGWELRGEEQVRGAGAAVLQEA